MRVLVVTKIFPNSVEPHSSSFNRQQFAELSRLCEVRIFASIPWFPGAALFRRWSPAGRLLHVPSSEAIGGLRVEHPRYAYVPKLGHAFSGSLYAGSLLPWVLAQRGRTDVVLGSWAYPDGFAAVVLAERLGVPAVVKVHGSDINVLGQNPTIRRRLREALPRAARIVAVSRPLAERVAELGVERERIDVVPNGVDTRLFHPRDMRAARRALGLELGTRGIVYVGRLERDKGVVDLVRAVASIQLDGVTLWLVGDGSARAECERLAGQLGVRLSVSGMVPHRQVADWITAGDVLALPSLSEGMPNVVLEALASGRRVVATSVGGIPDVVSSSELGELVAPGDVVALACALEKLLRMPCDAEQLHARAQIRSWSESAALLHESLLLARQRRSRTAA